MQVTGVSLLLQVYAQAYDNPVPGFETKTVGNLRLFEALPETELDMEQFNEGNFAKVVLWIVHAKYATGCAGCSLQDALRCLHLASVTWCE
jgi:glucan phosphorylase